jgi:hypothetical protein
LSLYYVILFNEGDREPSYLDVRFGFRGRVNGELAVAAWLPDLERCSDSERTKWAAFHLQEEAFAHEPDPRFELWKRRYIYGDWEVDNGVLFQISDDVASINSITEVVVGERLFELAENLSLIFPTAENDHRYQDAHREAYGYLVDGLRKPGIQALCKKLGVAINAASDKTLVSLNRLLPSGLSNSILGPFDVVSEQRRLATHRVRPSARPFPAFEQFSKDMTGVLTALRALRAFLESAFHLTGQQAMTRQSRISALPEIDDTRKPHANYSICQLPQVVGKTIARVDFGFRKSRHKIHESEAMILHFTDGSVLGIATGSNASNIAAEHEGLRAEDLHVDFMLTFVPPMT